ncbi:hypothetical protein DPX39_100132100 [Trypanosoma brucei equiperdum]|uniref:Uncharacterized protein n=1 Tax=Trypanosoma brucei equiperdum TaxID=630700 RepID=A0A3L6KY89_9TRYP|nr:hypothetical protein DPX39_100132100 [Trypanosoma brucei equiperdum]
MSGEKTGHTALGLGTSNPLSLTVARKHGKRCQDPKAIDSHAAAVERSIEARLTNDKIRKDKNREA